MSFKFFRCYKKDLVKLCKKLKMSNVDDFIIFSKEHLDPNLTGKVQVVTEYSYFLNHNCADLYYFIRISRKSKYRTFIIFVED